MLVIILNLNLRNLFIL